ncbi:MAG: hypothetical protein IPO27_14475 [Bacteroidetes bacterium]|nr:hypothetical protein [Bacteroidota bacterium]
MKIIKFAILIFMLSTLHISAQKTMNAIYELRGEREMGAGFEFTEQGKFNFYLAYGGLDRNATGTYTIENDTVRLKSDKVPASDYEVESRKNTSNYKGFVIKVNDKNSFILSYTIAVTLVDGQMHSHKCDGNGIIKTNTTACEKIFLWNQLYGDVMTEVYDATKDKGSKNQITVTMKPTLQQFTFTGINLFIKDSELILPANLLLNDTDLNFEKVK